MYYDDESYNRGHGHAYDYLGIKPEGAIVIVRPDQCKWVGNPGRQILTVQMSRPS